MVIEIYIFFLLFLAFVKYYTLLCFQQSIKKRVMEKYLVDIEFRYNDKKHEKEDCDYVSKTITVGVFDTLEEANDVGNKLLEQLERRFEPHIFPSGLKATKERFSKNGGVLGSRKNLITNGAYLKTPFSFFAHVKRLQYLDLDEAITEAVSACKRYREFKLAEKD